MQKLRVEIVQIYSFALSFKGGSFFERVLLTSNANPNNVEIGDRRRKFETLQAIFYEDKTNRRKCV